MSFSDPSIPLGAQGGGSTGLIQCESDELITGVRLKSGNYIDGITGIYCNTPNKIFRGEAPRLVDVKFGSGAGGTPETFLCPKGSALSSYGARYGNWIDSLTLQCSDLAKPDYTQTFASLRYGGGGGANEDTRRCSTQMYLNGLSGRGGTYLDQLSGSCKDARNLISTYNSTLSQLECCAGGNVADPFSCSLWQPSSSQCDSALNSTCQTPSFFFTNPCKKMNGGTQRQAVSSSLNDSAYKLCADIKNDPNSTQDQLDWCSCFNAEVDPSLDPVAKGVYQCINSTCRAKGLLPYGLQCPTQLAVCTQKDIINTLSGSQIGRQYLQNNCGNVIINPTNPTEPPIDPPIEPPTGSTTTKLSPAMIGGISIGFLVLLGLVLLAAKYFSKK